jgi:hypothetical protein
MSAILAEMPGVFALSTSISDCHVGGASGWINVLTICVVSAHISEKEIFNQR